MESRIVIRKGTQADLDRVVEIENLGFDSDRFSRKQLAYLILQAKGAFYIAEFGGEAAGYISVLTSSRTCNARIYAITVHPSFRGRGIARALIGKAAEYAVFAGKTYLSLEVRPDNLSAIKLYEDCGFRTTSVKPTYYSDRSPAWRMVFYL